MDIYRSVFVHVKTDKNMCNEKVMFMIMMTENYIIVLVPKTSIFLRI